MCNNNQRNARCAYRNRNQPDNRSNNLGFRVLLRSAHVLPHLLLVPLLGGATRQEFSSDCVPEMLIDLSLNLSAEAKEEEQCQTGLVRA